MYEKPNGYFDSGITSILSEPEQAEAAGEKLARRITDAVPANELDAVVSPAIDSIIAGFVTALHLKLPMLWTECGKDGRMMLHRFELTPGTRVAVVMSRVLHGGTMLDTCDCIEACGGIVVVRACFFDASDIDIEAVLGGPLIANERMG